MTVTSKWRKNGSDHAGCGRTRILARTAKNIINYGVRMKAIFAILLLFTTAATAFAANTQHRVTGGECTGIAHVYYLAAVDRDKGNTMEFVMSGMDQTRDSAEKQPDTYIYDLVKAGVTYVFKTPGLTPDQEGRNFLDFCNKEKGFVSSESDYFKGEQS